MDEDRRSGAARYWWVPVLVLALGALAGYAVGGALSKSESYSEVLIAGAVTQPATGPGDQPNLADLALTSNQYVTQRMPTYGRLAQSDLVIGTATRALGLPDGSLVVTPEVLPDVTVMSLTVRGPDPAQAQRRNQAVTQALQDAILATENLPEQPPRVQISVVTQPTLPEPPPTTAGSAAVIGGALGLIVGLVWLVVLARRQRALEVRMDAYDEPLPPLPRRAGPPPPAGPPPRRPRGPDYPPSPADGLQRPRMDEVGREIR